MLTPNQALPVSRLPSLENPSRRSPLTHPICVILPYKLSSISIHIISLPSYIPSGDDKEDTLDDNTAHGGPLAPTGIAVPHILPPAAYSIVQPTTAGSVLSLNAQHPHIRSTLRKAFDMIELDLLLSDGFPDALGCSRSISTAILESAQLLGFSGLFEHLNTDYGTLMRALSPLVSPILCCSPPVRILLHCLPRPDYLPSTS